MGGHRRARSGTGGHGRARAGTDGHGRREDARTWRSSACSWAAVAIAWRVSLATGTDELTSRSTRSRKTSSVRLSKSEAPAFLPSRVSPKLAYDAASCLKAFFRHTFCAQWAHHSSNWTFSDFIELIRSHDTTPSSSDRRFSPSARLPRLATRPSWVVPKPRAASVEHSL